MRAVGGTNSVIDIHTIAHSVVASVIASAARIGAYLVGGAAILLMMTLWLAVLWCCRLLCRGQRAHRDAPLAS